MFNVTFQQTMYIMTSTSTSRAHVCDKFDQAPPLLYFPMFFARVCVWEGGGGGTWKRDYGLLKPTQHLGGPYLPLHAV